MRLRSGLQGYVQAPWWIVLAFACGEGVERPECLVDGECPSGFCDRDACAEAGEPSLGRACQALPIDPETGAPDGRFDVCGGLLCIDGRCRSCSNDEECRGRSNSSDLSCQAVPDWPGLRCGDYSRTPSGDPAQPPPDDTVEPVTTPP